MGALGLMDDDKCSVHADSDQDDVGFEEHNARLYKKGKSAYHPLNPAVTQRSDKEGAIISKSRTTSSKSVAHTQGHFVNSKSNKSTGIGSSRAHTSNWNSHRQIEEPMWKVEDDSEVQDIKPNQHSTTARRAEGKRNKVQVMVKLKCSNTPIDLTTDDNVITNTDIVYPKKDGNLLLMQQPARVQEVCCAAISKILIDICFTHAFPDSLKMTFVRAVLIECANALQYTDIEKHLCEDISYADTLSKLPAQRIYNFCGEIKKKTDGIVSGHYQCRLGRQKEIDWLLQDLRYIYLCNPETEMLLLNKPFLHEGIITALQQCFFHGRHSFGMKNLELFTSSLPDKPDEKELPKAMCALASTAVRTSIFEFISGSHKLNNFRWQDVIDIYNENMILLEKIQHDGPTQYHALMHHLFKKASGMVTGKNETIAHS
ncbi:hypothetical protein AcV7_001598 [Taiwanofungus camphoratus]|nr:hypothetical protein AcV7_001598 [Antrodia cinnamomea]